MFENSVKLIKPIRFYDNRGFFCETYNLTKYKNLGISFEFVQDNHSFSYKIGTIRGLHFQVPPMAQSKLITCIKGAIFDIAVDIRMGSPNYGKWEGFELTEKNGHQIYIPIGFAHGFITLEEKSEIIYKCSNFYDPDAEASLKWDDPDLAIKWPLKKLPVLSKKDSVAPLFKNFRSPFILGKNS